MSLTRIGPLAAVIALFAAGCSQGNVFELEVGACFDDPPELAEIDDVPIRECGEPHDNEVYVVFDVSEFALPTETAMAEGCLGRFESAIGALYETSIYDIGVITPTPDSWDAGDREVICFGYIFDGPEKMTGSILGSGR